MDAVPEAFANAAANVMELEPDLDWFVRGVFSDEEIAAFVDVTRYIALDRLSRSYEAVRIDLAAAAKYLSRVDAKLSVVYKIAGLGGVVELTGEIAFLPSVAFDLPRMPTLISQHQGHYERLLLDHNCDMLVDQKEKNGRLEVARADLSLLKGAIDSISRVEAIDSEFEVRGAGGTFKGSIQRRNLPLLKVQLVGRVLVATLATGAAGGGVVAAFASESLQGLGVCGAWASLFVLPGVWSWVIEKSREVRDYDRGRAAGFAEGRR